MTNYATELAAIMAIFAFVIVSPGADLAMVMRQSIVHGRRAGIATSFGVGISLLFHVGYTILGLGLLISKSILFFNVVKWCGVAYLVYIGVQSLRSSGWTAPSAENGPGGPRQSAAKAFALGFAANALNPKPVFFFLSIFATVASVETPAVVKFGYGLVMATCLVAWFVGVTLFMTTTRMRLAFQKASRWIDRACGVVFIGLGVRLATEKAG